MTANDDLNRRSTDKRLEAMENRIEQGIQDIKDVFVRHKTDDHPDISRTEIHERLERQDDMEQTMHRMVVALEGEPKRNLQGAVIGPGNGGMIARSKKSEQNIEEILHRTNGGVNVTYKQRREWTRGEKIAAWSAGGLVFVGLLPNVLATLRYVAEWISTL